MEMLFNFQGKIFFPGIYIHFQYFIFVIENISKVFFMRFLIDSLFKFRLDENRIFTLTIVKDILDSYLSSFSRFNKS